MQRPVAENFNEWPEGWHYENLRSYFEHVEAILPITSTPSSDGRHYLDEAGATVLKDIFSTDLKWSDDVHQPSAGMMGVPRVCAQNGLRMSSTNVMLNPALKNRNIELLVEATVQEIFVSGSRATGVRFVKDGQPHKVMLRDGGLVVLSAGAFNTPRLLLSSGIGPSTVATGGVPLKIESPFVGRGISDHTIAFVTYALPRDKSISSFSYDPPSQSVVEMYVKERSGPLAQFGPTFAAFFGVDTSKLSGFDVEIFVNPAEKQNMLTIYFVLMRTRCSSANLRLDGERVTFDNYAIHTSCEQDRHAMQSAVDFVGAIMSTAGASVVHQQSAWPHVEDMNHWAGSCKLDNCADVETLIVQGTENVAVADASLLPTQIWAHPALTLTAIALKAADSISSHFTPTDVMV